MAELVGFAGVHVREIDRHPCHPGPFMRVRSTNVLPITRLIALPYCSRAGNKLSLPVIQLAMWGISNDESPTSFRPKD